MSDLRHLQKQFRAAVLGQDNGDLTGVVRAPGPTSDRLAVYRNTVQGSLVDALAATFPVVRRIVGEDFFQGFARRFVALHPPQRPQLSAYGAGFADIIASAEVGAQLPYLADVARLEWARNESYFAADAPLLDAQQIASDAEALEDMTLRFHPAARCLISRFPIFRIWEVNQPEIADVPAVDMSIAEAVLISRPKHHLVMRPITLGDAAFIAAIEEGETFGGAADTAFLNDPAFELQAALAQHFVHGTFAGQPFTSKPVRDSST